MLLLLASLVSIATSSDAPACLSDCPGYEPDFVMEERSYCEWATALHLNEPIACNADCMTGETERLKWGMEECKAVLHTPFPTLRPTSAPSFPTPAPTRKPTSQAISSAAVKGSEADGAGGSTSNATKALIAAEVVGIAICMLLIAVLFVNYFRREARAVGYFGSKARPKTQAHLSATPAALGPSPGAVHSNVQGAAAAQVL